MTVLGLDIGGANIKAATSDGMARSFPFALWERAIDLAKFLRDEVLPCFPTPRRVAVTLTGELCDCFENKADGVEQILRSTTLVCPEAITRVYATDGRFLSVKDAISHPLSVAASNWHALANLARRWMQPKIENGILIDIGSTSCDIIPLNREAVLAQGKTDTTRIAAHELVYTGVRRTPVCAVLNTVSFRDTKVALAQELFATMQDVYLVLGWIPEQADNQQTADGRSLTLANSKRRLARMLCADIYELTADEVEAIAQSACRAQMDLINHSIQQVMRRIDTSSMMFLTSGAGNFLISELLPELPRFDLEAELGPELCAASPAYAVAVLLEESFLDRP